MLVSPVVEISIGLIYPDLILMRLEQNLTLLIILTIFFGLELVGFNASFAENSAKSTFDYRRLTESIGINGQDRRFLISCPEAVNSENSGSKLPVLIVLHGGGGNASIIEHVARFDKVAQKQKMLLVYPQGSGLIPGKFLTWNAVDCCGFAKDRNIDDIGFIDGLIDRLVEKYQANPREVYLVGFSNGAMMAYEFACKYPSRIAGLGIVAGSMTGKEKSPGMPVPLLIIHALNDRNVPFSGGEGRTAKWGYPVNKMSVDFALDFWSKNNLCQQKPVVEQNDGYTLRLYQPQNGGAVVKAYILDSGGHSWPGGNKSSFLAKNPSDCIDASQLIWDFFQSQTIIQKGN